MARVEESIHIQALPEAVWKVVSDLSRIPEYVFFVREVFDISENPPSKGSTYKERAKPGPTESISEWRVTEFEPHSRQVHVGTMPEMNATLTITLEPAERGTRYAQILDFEAFPRFRPLGVILEPLVLRPKMSSDMKKILGNIKRIVESEAGVSTDGETDPPAGEEEASSPPPADEQTIGQPADEPIAGEDRPRPE